ncbi:hypothetical protein [Pseudomonas sp. JUb96]|uniref:hypothetical protein n=1 Tax=Pseudomonas sp. JUb96 TaxID=2940539 RepID=UPI002227B637|nr:hypothetical protein [Pseudomonas sp. JUb96]MCW2271598.1 hypothetical protein [Pseudomonas sp. JUb96]
MSLLIVDEPIPAMQRELDGHQPTLAVVLTKAFEAGVAGLGEYTRLTVRSTALATCDTALNIKNTQKLTLNLFDNIVKPRQL